MEDLKELTEITSSYSILYVEDDRDTAVLVIDFLSQIFKEVVYAENGNEALALYKQMNFEMVLTDIKMPIMSGLELSTEIKKIKKDQTIIIISAYTDIELFVSSIQLGIDGYLVKPMDSPTVYELFYQLAKKIQILKNDKKHEEQAKKYLEEIRLKNSELNQYRELIERVALVSKADLNGNITYVNDCFSEASGYSKEELLGSNHNIVRHPDMSKIIFKNLWDTIKSGNTWKGLIKNKTKEGETYFVNTMIIPMYDENKEIVEYMDIMFLVTQEENERRDFKKKVLTSYQELRKINYEISKKNEMLEQSLKIMNNDNLREDKITEEIKAKNKKLLTQIQFFEDEIRRKNLIHAKSIEKANSTLRDTNELYKKAVIKIKLLEKENQFIKNDGHLRKKEIEELNDKLKKLNTTIVSLKKMNIKESQELKESKKEKGFFDLLK